MFLKLVARLIEWDGQHFGGDVEADLAYTNIDRSLVRALYDLKLIEALPAPAEGEVRVDADRCRELLALVEKWSDVPAQPSIPVPESDWFEVQLALEASSSCWSPVKVKHPTYESALAAAQMNMGLFSCARIMHHRPGMKSSAVIKVVRREE